MNAANNLVDIIRDIVRQEIGHADTTVLCEVVSKTDDSHYDVFALPDRGTLIRNIPNMTKFDMVPGDYCYVYKIGNNLNNSFVCYKVNARTEDISINEEAVVKIAKAIVDQE